MKGWIGVDLDGTLAEYHGWKGPEHIGPPIKQMVKKVEDMLAQGFTVKIFTARASVPEQIQPIKKWLADNNLPDFEVTNVKDFQMVRLYDDRCVQVVENKGLTPDEMAYKLYGDEYHGEFED